MTNKNFALRINVPYDDRGISANMKFKVTFVISPSAPFGVPEEGMTVLPGGPGTHTQVGDTYHTATMMRVGYGSLSEYRKETDAIHLRLELGQVEARIHDNFAFLEVEASDRKEAFSTTFQAIDCFLQHLAINQRRVFTAKALIIESEDGKVYPVPKMVRIATVTIYALDKLRKDMQEAQKFYSVEDERLDRAMKYFEHSLLLYTKRNQIADTLSRHNDYLIASVFLNLWKAVSTIVGDPSRRKDSYQKRYKMIGLDSTYKAKIDRLKELRDNYDVAHYSLSGKLLQEVEKSYGEAINFTSEILQQYRVYLASKIKPGA